MVVFSVVTIFHFHFGVELPSIKILFPGPGWQFRIENTRAYPTMYFFSDGSSEWLYRSNTTRRDRLGRRPKRKSFRNSAKKQSLGNPKLCFLGVETAQGIHHTPPRMGALTFNVISNKVDTFAQVSVPSYNEYYCIDVPLYYYHCCRKIRTSSVSVPPQYSQ